MTEDTLEDAQESTQEIRDRILEKALPHIAFDGWTMELFERSAKDAGYEPTMAPAVFPRREADIALHFADWADRQMLKSLTQYDPDTMRVRDRVRTAFWERLALLRPYKEAARRWFSFCAVHPLLFIGSKSVWQTADHIWQWAGDTASDYNHYTKRGLLSGVITSTTLVWLDDQSEDQSKTADFLDRRIHNVLQFGKCVGKFSGRFRGKQQEKDTHSAHQDAQAAQAGS